MWFTGIIKGEIERLPTWNLIANASALKNGLHMTIAIAFTPEAFFNQPKWRRKWLLLSHLFPIDDKCPALKYDEISTHGHNLPDLSKQASYPILPHEDEDERVDLWARGSQWAWGVVTCQ